MIIKRNHLIKFLSTLLGWSVFMGAIIEEGDFPIVKTGSMVLEPGGVINIGSSILDEILMIGCWAIAIVMGLRIVKMWSKYKLSKKQNL